MAMIRVLIFMACALIVSCEQAKKSDTNENMINADVESINNNQHKTDDNLMRQLLNDRLEKLLMLKLKSIYGDEMENAGLLTQNDNNNNNNNLADEDEDGDDASDEDYYKFLNKKQVAKRFPKWRSGDTRTKVKMLHHDNGQYYHHNNAANVNHKQDSEYSSSLRKIWENNMLERNRMYQNLLG